MTPEMMCALYRSMAPAAFAEALASLLAAARAEALEEAARVSSPRRVGIAHRCDCADVIRALVNP